MEHKFIFRFVKGLTSTGFGTAMQIGLGMLGFIFMARVIQPNQLGAFVMLNVIALFFMMLSGLLLEGITVTRAIAACDPEEKSKIISVAIWFRVVIALVLSMLILIAKPLIGYLINDTELKHLMNYVAVLFLLISVDDILQKVLQGMQWYKKIAIAQTLNAVCKIVLLYYFLGIQKMDIHGAVVAVAASFVVSIAYKIMVIPMARKIRFEMSIMKAMTRFSFPLGINSVLTFVFQHLDNLMLGALLSPVAVAYYSIAAKVPESIRKMYESFYAVFFPNMTELIAKEKHHQAEELLNHSIRLMSFAFGFATLFVALFSKDIVHVLFSEKYMKSALAFSLLMITLGINVIGHMMGSTLVAVGRADTPVKINSITAAVNFIGNLIMIPMFGFMGAVLATLVSSTITNPIYLYFMRKTRLRVMKRYYLKPFIIMFVCWGAASLFNIQYILIKIGFLLLYLGGCGLLSVIQKQDLHAIQSMKEQMQSYKTSKKSAEEQL
jgi:O-antigen/teichoic acid export membrane protein